MGEKWLKEKYPLAIIYKQDGFIGVDFTDDGDKGFELYGFLKCLVKKMGRELSDTLEGKTK